MGWGSLNPFSDNRDDDAAKKATLDANSDWKNSTADFGAQSANLGGLAAQYAGSDYYGNARDVYGQQQGAAQMLQNQANGTAPSAAEIQMGLGLGQANQQAQAAALSQQGGVLSGNTQRNMLNAQAANSQSVIGQAASMRAQEQAAGQTAYSQLLSNMQQQQQQQGNLQYQQGQDYLKTQAGLNQGVLDANTQSATARLGNTMTNVNQQQAATAAGMKAGFNTVGQIGAAVASSGASSMLNGSGSSGGFSSQIVRDADGNYVTAPK